jgi:hypothetical protein
MNVCKLCERLNYAMACVLEIEMVEQARKRQPIARPWLDREEVRNRIMTGLQCSTNAADVLTDTLLATGHVTLSDGGRGVRPAAVRPMPCTHMEQAA